jgi:uncharacterized membrane protein YuzA (DUF378 family)
MRSLKDVVLFTLLLVFVLTLKYETLFQPYYWDAMTGIVGQSLLLYDNNLQFRYTGEWGHPPIQHYTLALTWMIFGNTLPVSHLYTIVIGVAGLTYTYKLGSFLFNQDVGIAAALLLLFNQLFYAQIGTLNDSIPLTTFSVITLYYYLRDRRLLFILSGTIMVLLKETAIVLLLAVYTHYFIQRIAKEKKLTSSDYKEGLYTLYPLIPLLLWAVVIYHTRGWVFRTDLVQNRMIFSRVFVLNIIRYFIHDFTDYNVNKYNFVLTAFITASLLKTRDVKVRLQYLTPVLIILIYSVLFAFTQDLPRYFTPLLPFYYLISAHSVHHITSKIRHNKHVFYAITGLCIILFTSNYTSSRPCDGWKLESNLEYLDVVDTHKEAAGFIEKNYPDRTIITCWPMTEELGDSRLGYVSRGVNVSSDPSRFKADSIFYYSRQSSCRNNPRYTKLMDEASLLKRFEKNSKVAEIYVYGV